MKLKKFSDSIAFRISAAIAVVVAVTTITVGLLLVREERAALETELQNKGAYLAELIAHHVMEPLISGESRKIYPILKGYMEINESPIIYAEVYSKDRKPAAKAYKDKDSGSMRFSPYGFDDSVEKIDIREDKDLHIYYVSLPLREEGLGTLGFLRICITKKRLYRTLDNLKHKLYLLAAIVISIGIVIGLWMARRILRPVLILNKGVKRVGDGEVGVEIPVNGEGEIKELTLSFNKMSKKLKESIDAIKAAQENFVRTEKLCAIGEFSAGVAHEIKNPLASIKMLMQALEHKKQPLSGKHLGIIQEEIDRIDRIIKQFLALARPAKTEKKDVNINDVLEEVIVLIRPKMEQSAIRLDKRLPPGLPLIKGNTDALKQVFINIILNSIQAMDEEGGTLTIETAARNGTLSAVIKDTGIGIPEKNLKKIFEPFFTTKEDGTGMGLALTCAIVNDHSGKIDIKSTPKIGTTITLELPL
ncbi:MAG: HAMP domain-containing protein [Nitrospirae bacterium]|nr:HAMP domain-containing protein [Nitrospirota bacterium]